MKKYSIFALILAAAFVFTLSLPVFAEIAEKNSEATVMITTPDGDYFVRFNHNWPNVTTPGGGGYVYERGFEHGDTMESTGRAMPSIPSPPGFVFGGWNTMSTGNGTTFTATTPITFLMNVYAVWNTPGTGPGEPGGPPPGGPGGGDDGEVIDIGDGSVPLGAMEGGEEFIDLEDGSVPLGAMEGDEEFIDLEDGSVPLGAMPQTGIVNNIPLFILGILISVLAVGFAMIYIGKLKKGIE